MTMSTAVALTNNNCYPEYHVLITRRQACINAMHRGMDCQRNFKDRINRNVSI